MAPNTNSPKDTKWADGLRGFASFLVVTAHISRSLAPYLLSPAMSATMPPVLLQLPFLRCLVMGRASVAIFAILSGYVNALKPIKQLRAGNIDVALSGIAKSAFRRTGRFVIPAVIATTLSWLVCQFGAYRLAKTVDSAWIRDTSPVPSPSFAAAVSDLFYNLITTWTDGGNEYDRIQWTLTYLLRGSMLVYLTMFATAYVQPRYRVLVYCVMYMFYWKSGDAVIGINIYAGLVLAEFSLDQDVQKYASERPKVFSVLSSSLIFLGLYILSYPEDNPEWARWSNAMINIGHYIFPTNSEFGRFYPGLGANLLTSGIIFNSTAKKILSHSALCWLGKLSFAIYLLHAPLLRTLLTWMLYAASSPPLSIGKDSEGNDLPPEWVHPVGLWLCFILVPLWYVMIYKIAQAWVSYVDPCCGRVTDWLEDKVFREEGKAEKSLLLP